MSAFSFGEESTPLRPVPFCIRSSNTLRALPPEPLSVMQRAMVLASASSTCSAIYFPLQNLNVFQHHSNFSTHLHYGQYQTPHPMTLHSAHSFRCHSNPYQSMSRENTLLPYAHGTLPKAGLPPFQKTVTPESIGLCEAWTTYSVLAVGPFARQSHLTCYMHSMPH